MQPVTHSAFLQALGYAIANSLWQTALLWLAVIFINGVFKFSATIKYRIALTAQITGFVWFLVTLFFYYQTAGLAVAQAEMLQASSNSVLMPDPNAVYKNNLLSVVLKVEQTLPYLSVAYLLLLSFLAVKWIRSYRYTRLIQNNGLHKIDVEWKLFVKKLSRELGIKADVKIYLSEIVNSPLTIGFLKPVILIPVASINHLTVQQLEAIILHEMAHIRRLDYLINLFVSIIELCLFFNPFTQLISKVIKNERENSCDDWVLQYQYQPAMYAEALLRLAYLQNAPALAMAAAGNKQVLLTRVKRMLDQQQQKFNYRRHLLALLMMTGVLSSLAWLDAPKKQSTADIKKLQPAVLEPLAARIDNPLLNPVFFLSEPLKKEVKKASIDAEKKIREAQIVIRDLKIPSISTAAAQKLQEINLDKMNAELMRMNEDLKLKEKDLATLKLNAFINNNTASTWSALASEAPEFYENRFENYYPLQPIAPPIVLNLSKLTEDMKKVKGELTKLNNEGWMKLDDKLTEKEFASFFKLAPMTAFATSADNYNEKITKWIESEKVELKAKREALKNATETNDRRRSEMLRMRATNDSLRSHTFRIAAGQNVWVYSSSAEEPTITTEPVRKPVTARVAPQQGGVYTTTVIGRPTRAAADLNGPPEDNESTSPRVTGGMYMNRIPRSSTNKTNESELTEIRTLQGSSSNVMIVDGKLMTAKKPEKERKLLRTENF